MEVTTRTDPEEARARRVPVWTSVALAVATIGVGVRVAFAAGTLGSNDIVTWREFAKMIRQAGLIEMYSLDTTPAWNHPPLTGYVALTLEAVAQLTHLPFYFVFKLAPVVADTAVMGLLWQMYSGGSRRTGALAVAVFALSPAAILVSGFHGNIDPVVGALVLASAWALERGRHGRAGLLLGLAINLKLIPVFLVPVLLGRAWVDGHLRQAAKGLAVSALPLIALFLATPAGALWHLVGYRPTFDNWGLAFLVRLVDRTARVLPSRISYPIWELVGRCLTVLASTLAGVLAARSRRSSLAMYAVGMALFLVFVPGFGVQWTAILGPILAASSWRWGGAWGLAAGTFIGGVYSAFLVDAPGPALSWFDAALPFPWVWLGLLAWGLLIAFCWRSVRSAIGRDQLRRIPSDSGPELV